MIDGGMYVTNDQGTIPYALGTDVLLPGGDALNLTEQGATLLTPDSSTFELGIDGALSINTSQGESIEVSQDDGFKWSDQSGSSMSIDPASMAIDASYAAGGTLEVNGSGELNVTTAADCVVAMYPDGSTSILMSDATSLVVSDSGAISVVAADGSTMAISSDGVLSVDAPIDLQAVLLDTQSASPSDIPLAVDALPMSEAAPLNTLITEVTPPAASPARGNSDFVPEASPASSSDLPSAPEFQPDAVAMGSADPTTEFPSAPSSSGEFPLGDTVSDFPTSTEFQYETVSLGSADPTTEFPSAPGSDGEFPSGDNGSDFPSAPDPDVFPDVLPEPEYQDSSAYEDSSSWSNSNE